MSEEIRVLDTSGQVEVRWYDGAFDAVAIKPSWANELDVEGLETAIGEAFQLAQEKVLGDPKVETAPRRELEVVVPADQLGLTPDQIISLMSRMTAAKDRALAEVARVAALPPTPGQWTFAQPKGRNVEVAASGTSILGVRLDREWVEAASASAISKGVTAAVVAYLEDPAEVPDDTTPEFRAVRAELDELISQAGMRRLDANGENS